MPGRSVDIMAPGRTYVIVTVMMYRKIVIITGRIERMW